MYNVITVRRPKQSSVNTRWFAVYWDGKTWTARQWREIKGRKRKEFHHSSMDYCYFWRVLKDACKKGDSYWVCGFNIYEFLCKADIYREVLVGGLQLTDTKITLTDTQAADYRKRLHGALICENPPTIIDAVFSSGGAVKFIDLKNYGLSPEMFLDDGESYTVDCVVQAIEDYICMLAELDMGQLKQTAAAQGYYCYRRSHMLHDLQAHSNLAVRQLERDSYFAGRCESRIIGVVPDYCFNLDVSSMYSHIGTWAKFPVKLLDYNDNEQSSLPCLTGSNHMVIADVTLHCGSPIFPVRNGGIVIYPTGQFRTALCGPELQLADHSGCIVKVHRYSLYACEQIFSSWSRWYFDSLEKLESLGLNHMRSALKCAVNSMYGKIGQRSRDWIDVPTDKPRYSWEQWWQRHPKNKTPVQWRAIDGLVQYLDAGRESAVSLPSISATMCSYGRLMLWNLICIAGKENVYYVDTDGIMCNERGYSNLLIAGEIKTGVPGFLRIREESGNVEIFGIKHYKFGERYCCAGVPDKNLVTSETQSEYDSHASFEQGLWHRRAFAHGYDRKRRKKTQAYRHGVVRHDGTIDPFVMSLIGETCYDSRPDGNRKSEYGIVGSAGVASRKSDAISSM